MNGMFRSEIGSGFGEPGGTALPRIPRRPLHFQELYFVGYDRIPHLYRRGHFRDTLWNRNSDTIPTYFHRRLFCGSQKHPLGTRYSHYTTFRLLENRFYSCRCTSRLYFYKLRSGCKDFDYTRPHHSTFRHRLGIRPGTYNCRILGY